ncbi:hypothetical protein DL98DRAFT_539305 [Cadophora sp. DSE1049]|nr:hypothetical protein DL98DRAFT_539305 [Cadophora sp. DSE1049]
MLGLAHWWSIPHSSKKPSRKLLVKADAHEDYNTAIPQAVRDNVLDQVWLLSFASLTVEARGLLGMLSFISPEDILPKMFQLNAFQVGLETEENSVLSLCEDEFELHEAMATLLKAALVEKETSLVSGTIVVSVHRLIQEAFIYNCKPEDRQAYFEAAVTVVYEAFPKQINAIARSACSDKNSPPEKALELRENFARSADPDLLEDYAVQLSNFGNLETAEGKLDAALKSFAKGEEMKLKMGTDAAISLGLTHIITGRALFEKGELGEAEARHKEAEKIFVQKFGKRAHFMAHLQYARGNLEVKRGNTNQGRKYYDESQDILKEEESTKFHILRSAIFYKIACLEIDG